MCVNAVRTVTSLSVVGLWLWSVLERYEGSGGGAAQQEVLGLPRADRSMWQVCCSEGSLTTSMVSLDLQTWMVFFRPFPNGEEGMVPNLLVRGKKKKAEVDSSPKPIYHTKPIYI